MLTIRDERAEALAREIAAITGESVDEVVTAALEERRQRVAMEPLKGEALIAKLEELARQCAALPILTQESEDEILGYDEFGAPTR